MPDVKRMISEVAAENGIRVEPGDPLFALVTMNRVVLEDLRTGSTSTTKS
jgi:hypothetical protein